MIAPRLAVAKIGVASARPQDWGLMRDQFLYGAAQQSRRREREIVQLSERDGPDWRERRAAAS